MRTEQLEAEEASPAKRPARRGWTWAALILVVLVGVFAARQLATTGTKPGSLARAYGFDIGDYPAISEEGSTLAPALEGPSFDGATLRLADYRGKVVVINLWGSWCGPCRKEQPELERMWREYRSQGVQFLGVDERDQLAAARAFREEFDVTYPSWIDDDAGVAFRLKVQVMPTTYVVDRNGLIVFRLTGRVDEAMLRTVLDGVLSKGSQGG